MDFLQSTITVAALIATSAFAQDGKDAIDKQMLRDAAQKGFKIGVDLNVQSNVAVEAVLLPPNVTRGLFGRSVSDRYAAVELLVSNRSRDAALIVHSIFLDYSRWLLSSITAASEIQECPAPGTTGTTLPACFNKNEPWQASTKSSQIAAAEYRIPRGTLLQAQQWSARNLTIRGLEFAGTIAAGYVFAFREPGIAKGIAAYNGNFLPAARYLLPDSSIDQANRISDLGFRVNKVIPKESSDVVVAFFPIDRFLTPGVKKLFEKSPAIFFVPEAALVDPKAEKLLTDAMPELAAKIKETKANMLDALANGKADAGTKMLDSLSLNRIRVVVGGAMTVDAESIPASIESVSFDEADSALLWGEPGTKSGTIQGRFLGGGKVSIANAGKLQITDLAVVQEGSTNESLRFTFKLNKPITSGEKLNIRVDKEDKSKKGVQGIPFDYAIAQVLLTTPAIDKDERSGDQLIITGRRFFSTDENPLTLTLEPGSAAGVQAVSVKKFERKPTEIKVDLTTLSLAPACWTTQVAVGTMTAQATKPFAQAPTPRIASAKKNGSRIVLAGEQFVNLKACGKELKFEIAEQATGSAFKAVENLTPVSAKEVSFDLPKTPADGKFKVRVLVAGVEADTRNVE